MKVAAFIWDVIKLCINAVVMVIKKIFGDKRTWSAWFMGYVPEHVSAYTVLAAFSMSAIRGVSGKERQAHRKQNEAVWQRTMLQYGDRGYIENQSHMTELRYGNYEGDYNSCEVIAVYNALQALAGLGSPSDVEEAGGWLSFPELLEYFEGQGIALSGGFGTSPEALYHFFKKKGYRVRLLVGRALTSSCIAELAASADTFIMTAYNDRASLKAMIHTVSITKEHGSYVIHNAGTGAHVYPSLEEAVTGYQKGQGKAICLIGIASQKTISLL